MHPWNFNDDPIRMHQFKMFVGQTFDNNIHESTFITKQSFGTKM